MAGLGRKIFNSGDILLASEVQGFLQDQAVMVFDDSATRATAIGTANFSEGMVTYTKDDDAIQVFDGTSFVAVGSEPGLVHIETLDTGGAVSSLSFNDVFTTNFSTFKIVVDLVVSGDLSLRLRENGVDFTGSNYLDQRAGFDTTSFSGSRTTATQFVRLLGRIATGAVTATTLNGELVIQNPAQADLTAFNSFKGIVSGGNTRLEISAGCVQNTTSFDGFTVFPSAGTMNGKVAVYGYRF